MGRGRGVEVAVAVAVVVMVDMVVAVAVAVVMGVGGGGGAKKGVGWEEGVRRAVAGVAEVGVGGAVAARVCSAAAVVEISAALGNASTGRTHRRAPAYSQLVKYMYATQ